MPSDDTVLYEIPSESHDGHGLGRSIVSHDPRSLRFPARLLLTAEQREAGVRQKRWGRVGIYDQGTTPHCVAFAGKGAFNTEGLRARFPYRQRVNFSTDEWYGGAQANDEWPGTSYDGTSALGLCKYLSGLGLISEYRWCFGLTDVLLTLSHVGPVLLGVWWYEDMFRVDDRGYVHPTGERVGGHEVELVGVTPPTRTREGYVTVANSWGRDWGVKGRALLSFTELETLLHQDGDAVVLIK